MNILVLDQPLNNRGDESASKALMRNLSHDFPNDNFELVFIGKSQSSIDAFNVHLPNVEYVNIKEERGFLKAIKLFLILPIRIVLYMHPTLKKMNYLINKCDKIICSPGGMNMGGFHSWNHIGLLRMCKLNNKPIYYYGRSIGPFADSNRTFRFFNKVSFDLLKYFNFISLRDSISYEIAKNMGLNPTLTTDTAFIDNPDVEFPEDVVKIVEGHEYIVFVPNELTWHPKYKLIEQSKIDKFYIDILSLIQKYYPEYRIIMLPQLFNSTIDDYNYFERVFSDKDNVFVIDDCYSSDIQQSIIKKSKFVIGARYHSIVFAINNNIPFISLCYEHKMEGLLRILGDTGSMVKIDMAFDSRNSMEDTLEKIESIMNNLTANDSLAQKAKTIAYKGYLSFKDVYNKN